MRQKSVKGMKETACLFVVVILSVITAWCWCSQAVELPPYDFVTSFSEKQNLVIYYPSALSAMAVRVDDICDRSIPQIRSELGVENADTVKIYIARNRSEYIKIIDGNIREWSAAVSFLRSQTMVINASKVLKSPRPLEEVVRHELSHLFLGQRIGRVKCPTWFMEGLAMSQSGEWTFTDQWKLAESVWRKEVPYLDQLKGEFPQSSSQAAAAYRVSYAAFRELFGESPGDLITFTAFLRDIGNFDRAFFLVFGRTTYDFSINLQLELEERYAVAGGLIGSVPYVAVMTLLFLVTYGIKRYRTKRKLEVWEEEDGELNPG
jgi:hypothetical protein